MQFDGNELKTNSGILQIDYNNSERSFADQKKMIRSNTSVLHWDDLINVWNPYTMARLWNRDTHKLLNISTNCDRDFTNYMLGFSTEEPWALKSK